MPYHRLTRSERAIQTAINTGYWQYGLRPVEIAQCEESIQSSRSRFITRIGKLTIHKAIAGNHEVFCAYDSKISKIGFFIEEGLGRRILRRVRAKRNNREIKAISNEQHGVTS